METKEKKKPLGETMFVPGPLVAKFKAEIARHRLEEAMNKLAEVETSQPIPEAV